MTAVIFRRLLPEPADVDADTLIGGLDLGLEASEAHPYTLANFVTTADGSATFQGRSSAIGDDGDRAMFHALREHVDGVVAGTGTLRAERYGRILGKAERRERRVAAGRSPEPLACVITRSGQLPLDIPLFAEPEAEIVIFSAVEPRLDGVSASVQLEHYDAAGERPLTQILGTLRRDYGVRSLLCEGGPSLFSSLLREQLVDELFLTLAPKLSGGSIGPRMTTGTPLPELQPLRIRWLLQRDGALYVRYSLR